MKNIALFGGSFDPPHIGHVAVIEKALQQLDIEKLIIVPAYLNPFKSHSHAPAELRMEWLERIFADYPDVEISDYEVTKERPVPSIETVTHFRQDGANVYLVIGADNLASLKAWHRFDELDALVTWVIATRGDVEVPPHFIRLDISKPVSSTQLRERIEHRVLPASVAEEIAQFYTQNKETNATTHRKDQ